MRRDAALDQRAREQIAVPRIAARPTTRAASPAATRAPMPRSGAGGSTVSAPPATISVGARISAVLARSAPPAIVTSARTRSSCDATSAAVRPPNEWPKTPSGPAPRATAGRWSSRKSTSSTRSGPCSRRGVARSAWRTRPRRSRGSRAERTAACTPPGAVVPVREDEQREAAAAPDRVPGDRVQPPAHARRGAGTGRARSRAWWTSYGAAARRRSAAAPRRGPGAPSAPAAREQHQRHDPTAHDLLGWRRWPSPVSASPRPSTRRRAVLRRGRALPPHLHDAAALVGRDAVRVLEPSHRAMNSSLHPLAASEDLDLGAFLYATRRLPDEVADAKVIVMGQEAIVFKRNGIGPIEEWEPLEAPARRRRWFHDGDGHARGPARLRLRPRRPHPHARRLPDRVEQAAREAARGRAPRADARRRPSAPQRSAARRRTGRACASAWGGASPSGCATSASAG